MKSSTKSSIGKGTFYLTISTGVFVVSGYVVNIWLGRFLGPIDYGIYGVVISIWNSANLILTAGLPRTMSKFIAENTDRPDDILASTIHIQLISSVIISLFFYIFAANLATFFNDPSMSKYIKLSAFIFPFYSLYSVYLSFYNGLHKFGKQSLISILYSLSKLLITIFFSLIYKINGAILGFVISPLIGLIPGFFWPHSTKRLFPYKKLIFFSLPLIGFAILSTLQQTIDLYFIKYFFPYGELPGYYTASQNISRVPYFALSSLSLVIFPSISKAVWLKDSEKTQKLVKQSLRYLLMLLSPIVTILAATSQQLITLLYSNAYVGASRSLSILIFGIGFHTIFTLLATMLSGAGKPHLSVWSSLAGVVITSVSAYFLVRQFGLVGGAFSTTLGTSVSLAITLVSVKKLFKVLMEASSLLKILISTSLIGFLANILKVEGHILVILYPVLIIFYFTILILLRELNSSDFKRIQSIWKSN